MLYFSEIWQWVKSGRVILVNATENSMNNYHKLEEGKVLFPCIYQILLKITG